MNSFYDRTALRHKYFIKHMPDVQTFNTIFAITENTDEKFNKLYQFTQKDIA